VLHDRARVDRQRPHVNRPLLLVFLQRQLGHLHSCRGSSEPSHDGDVLPQRESIIDCPYEIRHWHAVRTLCAVVWELGELTHKLVCLVDALEIDNERRSLATLEVVAPQLELVCLGILTVEPA
jgi:hypothetical protein